MMNDNYNTPNSGCCGRPFPTAPENKCNYNDCCMNEYAYKQKACIRNKQPDCESQAVIPSITVETVDGISNLANCLVHVTSTNTTYYVDDKHRIMITWAGPVNIPGYDMVNNPNHYKNQIVSDVDQKIAVLYDNNGRGFTFAIDQDADFTEAVQAKLDEMAADGTLGDIIAPLLDPYFEQQREFEKMMNWENVETKKYRDTTAETDYYITTVPYDNPYGGDNIFRLGLANDDTTCTTVEKPTDFAYRKESPVVLNAGIFTSSSLNPHAYGVVVKDGVILKNDAMTNVRYRDLLAIKANGDMACFNKESANLQVLINEGYLDIILGYYGIIIDGQVVDYSSYIDTEANPREIICRKTNGDYLILTCDGRTESNKGLSVSDVVRILGNYDISFAFVLDGGGSTGCIVKGEKINRNIDDNGTDERAVATLLYIDSKASELYFQSGAIHNNLMVKEAETDMALGLVLNIKDYFGGNLFNKNDTHFLTNKYIDGDGTVLDYNNTSGYEYNDLMLSDYIPIPTNTRMFCVKPDNNNDWAFIYLFDKDKNFTRRVNYYEITGNTFRTTENEHYCRVVVRKRNFRKFGIYIGNTYDSTLFEPYKYLQPKIIFNDDSGSRDVTLGYLGMYDKIKIYYTNSSSLANANEIAIPSSLPGSLYTNLLVCQNGTDSEIAFITARLSINTDTGVVTFDRECRSKIETTPAVTNTAPGDGNFKIVRVEAI